jgi:hypothetical protein
MTKQKQSSFAKATEDKKSLDEIALACCTDKASPQHDYAKVYEHYLWSWRDAKFTLLEIGVASGASLKMWKEYFPNASIYGIDNNPDCAKVADNVFIGDQTDATFLTEVIGKIGKPHIIIDDGGHIGAQTVRTFQNLFQHVASGGHYVVEDTHCFYHPLYSEGAYREGDRSFAYKFFSDLAYHVDIAGRGMTGNVERALNWHDKPAVPDYSHMLKAMHIHTSLWWFEKR